MHHDRIGMKVCRAIWIPDLVHLWNVGDHREYRTYSTHYLSFHLNAMSIVYIPL